jgi:hypothetical protein
MSKGFYGAAAACIRCAGFGHLGRALADAYADDERRRCTLGFVRIVSIGQQVGRDGQG